MLRFALPLCLAFATSTYALDLDAMSDAERAAFQAEVRAYLMENPDVLREAIINMQQFEQQQERNNDMALAQANADALFNDGHSFIGGNPDGDITIVEFMDYRCGFCKRAFPELQDVLEADPNIRYIVKEFPILGETSVLASRYAIATQLVAGNAAYENVHNTLMEFRGDITLATLRDLSDAYDLEHAAIFAMMEDAQVTDIINKNRALAQQLQITGTPTFVVQDQMLRGFVPGEQIQQIVADLRDQ